MFLPIRTHLFLVLLAFSYVSNCQVATDLTRITNVQDSYPVISPDGRYVMFQSNRTGNSEIFVTTITGDSLKQLTINAADDSSPIWSPDGNQIVFSSDRDGNPEIYIMQSDGRGQTRLTRFEGDDNHPHWSPDGKKIIFNSARTTADIKLPWGQQVHEIFIMNADGSDVKQVNKKLYNYIV